MEPAVAGALYAAETVVEGAAALFKGLSYPTAPLRATISTIDSVPVPRSHHTISVVHGRAYVFGGETAPGRAADNAMTMIILPSSAVHEADYTVIPARAAEKGGPIPAARKGHTASVIGEEIFIYGGELLGRGDTTSHTQEERQESGARPTSAGIIDYEESDGTVWVYHTRTRSWRRIQPGASSPAPPARTSHSAAASLEPGPKHVVTHTEVLPQQPADPASVVPEPPAPGSYGSIFVHGGRATAPSDPALAEAKGKGKAASSADAEGAGLEPIMYNDLWALDVRTGVWSNLPPAPGPGREGAALAVVGHRAYRFGGSDARGSLAPQSVDWIDISAVVQPREGKVWSPMVGQEWEEVPFASATEQAGEKPGEGASPAPSPRRGASFQPVTTGQGRTYLLLLGGEDATGLAGSVWSLQLPSESGASAARAKDRTREKVGKKTGEALWSEVRYRYVDAHGDEVESKKDGSGPHGIDGRRALGVSADDEVDGATVVIWGGVDSTGRVKKDGVHITVDR